MIIIADQITKLNFEMLAALQARQIELARKKNYRHLSKQEGMTCAKQDYYEYLRDVFFSRMHGEIYIYEEDGCYICGVCFEPYKDGLLLNSLVTLKDYRRKGYAEKLLVFALEHLNGRPVYSHIHENNFASIRLHEKLGFQFLYSYGHMLDGTVRSNHFTYIKII